MELAFGAGSVPCRQQHTMSTEIEPARRLERFLLVWPSRVRCSVFWSPFSPWQFFVVEKSNRGLRGLNGSEGSAFHRRYPRYQRFNNSSNFCEMSVFKSLRKWREDDFNHLRLERFLLVRRFESVARSSARFRG